MPLVGLPYRAGWKWEKYFRSGDFVEQIIHAERDQDANLICMMRRGHNELLDEIRVNRTERIVRKARGPYWLYPPLKINFAVAGFILAQYTTNGQDGEKNFCGRSFGLQFNFQRK